jgi:hypothetical protein
MYLVAAVLVLIISCSPSKKLTDVTWSLNSLNDTAMEKGKYAVLFNDTGTVEVTVDCNSCFGKFKIITSDSIAFDSGNVQRGFLCTQVGCSHPDRDAEYENALVNAGKYAIDGNNLTLFYGNEGKKLNFTAE